MNNKKLTILILSLFISLIITSCDVKSPIEGFEIIVKTKVRTTMVTVEIIDASTGNPIEGTVEINFSGKDASKVISDSNVPLTSITTSDGQILFAIQDDVDPSTNNIQIVMACESDGYLATAQPIAITSSGINEYFISMVQFNNIPVGVETKEANFGNVGSSGTTNEIKLATDPEANTNTTAEIIIPSGTKFYNESGAELTGQVIGRVTYFNPEDAASLRSFPGGFSVSAKNEDGVMEEIEFITAGFTAIDFTVGGTPVESFSQAVTVGIEIPSGTINPATGNPLAPGDVVPMWSFNEVTGEWKWEKDLIVPVANVQSGVIKVSNKEVTHLSYWNLDWRYYGDPYCRIGTTFNLTGECFDKYAVWLRRMDGKGVLMSNGNRYLKSYAAYVKGSDPKITFKNAPSDIPMIIEVRKYVGWYTIGDLITETTTLPHLCSTNPIDIPLPSSASQFTEVEVNVNVICNENDPVTNVLLDGFPLYMKGPNSFYYSYVGTINSGQINLCMELGKEYLFRVYYDGQYFYSKDYPEIPRIVTESKYRFTAEYCN